MARTRQLSDLRDECRLRADQVGSSLFSDAQVTRFINQSIARLYGKLVQARGDQYYLTSSTDSTTLGTATLALPAGFFKLWGVDYQIGSDWRAMGRLNRQFRDRYDVADQIQTWNIGTPWYTVEGSNLRFFPTPQDAYSVRIWYVPYASDLAADGDTFDGINGWEDWVVLDVAIKMMDVEEGDTTPLYRQQAMLERDIETLKSDRDHMEPPRVARHRVLPRHPSRYRGWSV